MVYGISPSTDPRFNLAMEQYLFEEEPRKGPWFLLWQNDNAIIVGRNQNTETELDGDYTRARGIRDQVKIMVGGAPISQAFCDEIGADAYTPDAGTAARTAVALLRALKHSL